VTRWVRKKAPDPFLWKQKQNWDIGKSSP
jgi:hypothetical protein